MIREILKVANLYFGKIVQSDMIGALHESAVTYLLLLWGPHPLNFKLFPL